MTDRLAGCPVKSMRYQQRMADAPRPAIFQSRRPPIRLAVILIDSSERVRGPSISSPCILDKTHVHLCAAICMRAGLSRPLGRLASRTKSGTWTRGLAWQADEAGAALEAIQGALTHTGESTTLRYLRRGRNQIGQVAQARSAKRATDHGPAEPSWPRENIVRTTRGLLWSDSPLSTLQHSTAR